MKTSFLRIIAIPVIFILAGCASQSSYIKLDASLTKDIKTFNGSEYLPLIKVCDVYGFSWDWDSYTQKVTVEKSGRSIVMRASSDSVLINGVEKKLDRPVVLESGTVYVPASFARKELTGPREIPVPEPPPQVVPGMFGIRTIVLDSGHGGGAVGAVGRRLHLKEKFLTVEIAKKLKDTLERKGIKVIMTRTKDASLPLRKRVELANTSGADLFVSVHINSSKNRNVSGFECYYLSGSIDDTARAREAAGKTSFVSEDGIEFGRGTKLSATLWDMVFTEDRREAADLAASICKSVEGTKLMPKSRVKFEKFYVLKYSRIPAVLVEMGYLSNWQEERKFKDPKFIDTMTDAIANGILNYKREYEYMEGFTKT